MINFDTISSKNVSKLLYGTIYNYRRNARERKEEKHGRR